MVHPVLRLATVTIIGLILHYLAQLHIAQERTQQFLLQVHRSHHRHGHLPLVINDYPVEQWHILTVLPHVSHVSYG